MKKAKSAATKAVKLSESELLDQIVRYEKLEIKLKRYGMFGAVIGAIGAFGFLLLKLPVLPVVFLAVLLVGGLSCYLGVHLRRKAESLVSEQMNNFFESELESAFGPRMYTPKMSINEQFLNEICLADQEWNRYSVWRFYEGNYNGTHFSAANVKLYKLLQVTEEDNSQDTTKMVFEGVVLRCEDICGSALDIALRRPWEDNHKDGITDPAVFRQHFSARTADDQPADDLVSPQLRELIRKLESLDKNYRVIALILRDGEVTLAIGGYAFAESLPSDGNSLQSLDGVRRRFKTSLTPMGNLIDILQDSCGKI